MDDKKKPKGKLLFDHFEKTSENPLSTYFDIYLRDEFGYLFKFHYGVINSSLEFVPEESDEEL